jgi:hypothetical protein
MGEDRRRERLTALHRLEAGVAGAQMGATWLTEEDGDGVLAVASWVRPDPPLPAETVALLDREVPALIVRPPAG